jgi:hypothetical protein
LADYRRICPTIIALFIVVAGIGDALASNFSLFPEAGYAVHEFFKGSQHEVRVHVIRGAEPGPTVLLVGGIHGDEPATAMAADRYAHVLATRGSLIVVPRLNRPAVVAGTRPGRTGDMNRLFDLPETGLAANDRGVVTLAKLLISQSDYVLNLHQGSGFYAPSWVNRDRNPSRWGQTYVIDAPVFEGKSGGRLELMSFATSVTERSNARISDPLYRFRVRNTDTERKGRVGKEQHKSLTFFAVSQASKMALGIEATKNCSRHQAVALLVTATDSVLQEAGVMLEQFPSDGVASLAQSPEYKAINPGRCIAALDRTRAAVFPSTGRPGR